MAGIHTIYPSIGNMTTQRLSPHSFRLLLAAVAVVLIGGATLWAAYRADRDLRAELLLQTRLVAQAVDLERVAALTGTEADLASPDYVDLKEQMSAIRLGNPNGRFIYLLGLNAEGQVIFFVDSEPEQSKYHSPPGQIYEDVSDELLDSFALRQAFVEGPLPDERGVWVSALVPIIDPKTGSVLTVLGMDIGAPKWKWTVAMQAALPAAMTALAVLFALLAILLQESRRKHRARRAELQESEAQKQAILNGITTNIALVDKNLNILWANQAAAASVRKRPEDLVGQPCHAFWGDPAKPCADCPTLTAFQTGTSAHKVVKSPDGRIWDEAGEPVFDTAGNVVAVVEIAQDITGIKQAEAARRKSEQDYRRLIENSRDIIYTLSLEGTFRFVSQAWTVLLGHPVDQVVGKSFQDFVHPQDLAGCMEVLQKMAGTEQSQAGVEYRIRHADGSWRWHSSSGVSTTDGSGRLVDFQGIAQDITERKQIETYRTLSSMVLQLLNGPESLPDSIAGVLATVKTLTSCDAVGIRLQDGEDFPYAAQQGFSADFLLTENTLIERGADGGACRDEKGKIGLECTCGLVLSGKTDPSNPLFTRGGSYWTNDSFPLLDLPADQDPRHHPRNQCMHHGYASVALVPIRAKDQIVGLLQLNDRTPGHFSLAAIEQLEGIAAHVGEGILRKRSEERIHTLLAESNKARIALLGIIEDEERAQAEKAKLEANLHQAQKMESVGRLAGGVAHDFNNMLGVILGRSEMALEQINPASPIHAELLEIRDAALRSADITRQLLAFARKQVVAPKVLDLNKTVAGMLQMLRRLIGENIALVWKPKPHLWPVNIDPSQVDQILANLCVNARDAIAGVGKISIESGNSTFDEDYCIDHVEFTQGQYVWLAVGDTGCGMDREALTHIFEPFFTTKAEGEGTGLGLATVYGIVKQNNGFLHAYSEPGQGTLFKIYLPRHGKADAPSGEQAPAAPLPRGQETILLVEDDPPILRMTGKTIERQGYTVLTADSPGEAIRLAQVHVGEIHLLMTDVVMPEMNGHDLARRLQSLNPRLRVLFMSGYTADIIARNGVLDDGVNFIQKPFSRQDLAAKIREVLDAPPRGGR